MPDVRIKTPNLDEIFSKWKERAAKKDKNTMERQFGTKAQYLRLTLFLLLNMLIHQLLKELLFIFP